MTDRETYDSAVRMLLRHRGRTITKKHLEILRNNIQLLQRHEIAGRGQMVKLQVAQIYFSPLQTDYVSSALFDSQISKREIFNELNGEYHINIDNIAGTGMHKMRQLTIQNNSDVEYLNTEKLIEIPDDEEFLAACYIQILGRAHDQFGLQSYLAMLQSNSLSRKQIISDIWHSEEGQTRPVIIYDQDYSVAPPDASFEIVDNQVNLPLVVVQNAVVIPGFKMFLKEGNERYIAAGDGEYILYGPKCVIEKGLYFLDVDIEITEGCFQLDMCAFAGKVVINEFPMRGHVRGEFGFKVDDPMDLFEVRLMGYGAGQNKVRVNKMFLRGRGA